MLHRGLKGIRQIHAMRGRERERGDGVKHHRGSAETIMRTRLPKKNLASHEHAEGDEITIRIPTARAFPRFTGIQELHDRKR